MASVDSSAVRSKTPAGKSTFGASVGPVAALYTPTFKIQAANIAPKSVIDSSIPARVGAGAAAEAPVRASPFSSSKPGTAGGAAAGASSTPMSLLARAQMASASAQRRNLIRRRLEGGVSTQAVPVAIPTASAVVAKRILDTLGEMASPLEEQRSNHPVPKVFAEVPLERKVAPVVKQATIAAPIAPKESKPMPPPPAIQPSTSVSVDRKLQKNFDDVATKSPGSSTFDGFSFGNPVPISGVDESIDDGYAKDNKRERPEDSIKFIFSPPRKVKAPSANTAAVKDMPKPSKVSAAVPESIPKPSPVVSAPPPAAKNESSGNSQESSKPSIWNMVSDKVKCNSCLVQNEKTADKCVACEMPLGSSAGSGKANAFASAAPSAAAKSTVTWGAPAAAPSSAGIPSFGAPISFGAPAAASTAAEAAESAKKDQAAAPTSGLSFSFSAVPAPAAPSASAFGGAVFGAGSKPAAASAMTAEVPFSTGGSAGLFQFSAPSSEKPAAPAAATSQPPAFSFDDTPSSGSAPAPFSSGGFSGFSFTKQEANSSSEAPLRTRDEDEEPPRAKKRPAGEDSGAAAATAPSLGFSSNGLGSSGLLFSQPPETNKPAIAFTAEPATAKPFLNTFTSSAFAPLSGSTSAVKTDGSTALPKTSLDAPVPLSSVGFSFGAKNEDSSGSGAAPLFAAISKSIADSAKKEDAAGPATAPAASGFLFGTDASLGKGSFQFGSSASIGAGANEAKNDPPKTADVAPTVVSAPFSFGASDAKSSDSGVKTSLPFTSSTPLFGAVSDGAASKFTFGATASIAAPVSSAATKPLEPSAPFIFGSTAPKDIAHQRATPPPTIGGMSAESPSRMDVSGGEGSNHGISFASQPPMFGASAGQSASVDGSFPRVGSSSSFQFGQIGGQAASSTGSVGIAMSNAPAGGIFGGTGSFGNSSAASSSAPFGMGVNSAVSSGIFGSTPSLTTPPFSGFGGAAAAPAFQQSTQGISFASNSGGAFAGVNNFGAGSDASNNSAFSVAPSAGGFSLGASGKQSEISQRRKVKAKRPGGGA